MNAGYQKGYEEGKEKAEKLIDEALEIKNSYISMKNKALKEARKGFNRVSNYYI